MIADELYISEAYIDEGPTMKRYKPRAMGQASPINKRTSHVTVKVAEKKGGIMNGSEGTSTRIKGRYCKRLGC